MWAFWCAMEVLWTGLCCCSTPVKQLEMLPPLLAPVMRPCLGSGWGEVLAMAGVRWCCQLKPQLLLLIH